MTDYNELIARAEKCRDEGRRLKFMESASDLLAALADGGKNE